MTLNHLLPALNKFLEAANGVAAVRRKERVLRPLQKQLVTKLAAAFRAQGKKFVAEFEATKPLFQESLSRDDWFYLFERAVLSTELLFAEPIQVAVSAALLAGANALTDDMGEDASILSPFKLDNPRAVRYMQEHGAELVTNINRTTRDYLNTLLTDAAENGWSWSRTAQAIIARYEEFAAGAKAPKHLQSRAELIAVTELGNAYEAGNEIVAADLQAAGLEMEKAWSGPNDDITSQPCLANMAQGWIPFDEEFQSGDMRPLHHPGCRHTCLYRRKGSAT